MCVLSADVPHPTDGWMDGWGGWMDGVDGWMEWMDGWIDGWHI